MQRFVRYGHLVGVLAGMGIGALAGFAPGAAPVVAQEPESSGAIDTVPRDAFADPGVGDLIERARTARHARATGLESFEVTLRERIYAGLGGAFTRRERAMFHQERAARVYWGREGRRIVRWLGVRRGVPILGLGVEFEEDLRADDAFDLEFEVLDPSEDRLFLGSDWALHPLADSAARHYRYRSGDTLRIRFPGSDRTITLVEAIVEPREARFDRIVGSLWFDRDRALLVRAVYRPAIEYDFDREEPEDAREVPGFMKPIRATVEYITVDYGMQELRWWLPNRMAFDGRATVGDFATLPLRFEWSFEDYTIDGPPDLDPGAADLPPGWTRWVEEYRTDDGASGDTAARAPAADSPVRTPPADSVRAFEDSVIVIVPPLDSLSDSPALPRPLFSASVEAFDEGELSHLRSRLNDLEVPGAPLASRFAPGPLPGLLRFNRVEGLSAGWASGWPAGGASELRVTGRIGVPEWEPGLEVRWIRSTAKTRAGFGVYRRLTDLGDWGRPLGLGNSINTLLAGYDNGLYFRETGFEAFATRMGARTGWEVRAFAERQQTARKNTDVSLPDLFGDRALPPNVVADRGEVAGLSARLRLFSGVDPGDPIVSATLWGEGAVGDFDYGRAAATVALGTPLVGAWRLGLEAGAGTTLGDPPAQRLFHLGGPYTLRAFDPGSASGEAFWLGRAEIGRGFRVGPAEPGFAPGGLRVSAFGDAAWAGGRDAFGTQGWKASLGVGLSLLDGILRVDLGRGVRGGDAWRLHIYADGLM